MRLQSQAAVRDVLNYGRHGNHGVLTLALVVFDPKRIPEIGSSLGKGIRDFKKGISRFEEDTVSHDTPEVVAPGQIGPIASERKVS